MIETLKILDTFAGIGGFSYAAHELVGGFETTQFVEIDPFCQKVLKKHFPNVPCHDDIKTFTAYPGQYDVITGGFPCQDISVAGRKEGITKQSRSGLFYELIRVIRLVRPKFVVMENVAAILNNGLDIVLGELSEAGYDAEWSIISASSLGAAHRRSRWWCVAYTDSFGCGGGSGKGCSIQERPFFPREQKGSKVGSETERCSSYDSDSNSERLQREIFREMESRIWSAKHTRRLDPNWRSYVSKPILPRGSYGLSNRVDRTKALGNSIVPAVAAIPLQRVHDLYFK
ncbi:MAG: DNA (cytosine-5-)-methyltransferase [Candidatus Thermoplasmatota archaeon]|nr:DNA (cytosine-5-)-methyltransferase [Candidatus Thermoplasmatota archaeon]